MVRMKKKDTWYKIIVGKVFLCIHFSYFIHDYFYTFPTDKQISIFIFIFFNKLVYYMKLEMK